MHGAGVKRLALSLTLKDDDVVPRSPHTHHRVAGVNDHYHILHRSLPQLLAACPTLRLHLRICGSSLFVPCSFEVPRPPFVVCFPPRVTIPTVVRKALGSDVCGLGPFSLQCLLDDTGADRQMLGVLCEGPSYLAVSSSSWLQCTRGHCSAVEIP